MTAPQSTLARNQRLLIIIGGAIVVLLAIIAIAVSSQAIRTSQDAKAKASTEARASASAKAVIDAQTAIEVAAAQRVLDVEKACHQEVQLERPTALFKSTTSKLQGSQSYETYGTYADRARYGNDVPMQYVCVTKETGKGWTSTVTALGKQ